ncbi:MAG: hypothetical protein ACOYJD_04945 [Christensenellales bacterium]|jgi:stage III sporulation protein AG
MEDKSALSGGRVGDTLKKLTEAFKTKKGIQLVAAAIIVVVIIALYLSPTGKEPAADSNDGQAAAAVTPNDEERLIRVLSKISGAGKVDVMITYENSGEIIPAMSSDVTTSENNEINQQGSKSSTTQSEAGQPATYSSGSGNQPIVITEIAPKARGVIVVAEGAEDMAVRIELIKAVSTVMDIPVSAVEVFVMEKDNKE